MRLGPRVCRVLLRSAFVVVALGLSACSSGAADSGETKLSEQTRTVGGVEVKVTPTSLSRDGAAFTIALNTHAGSLDGDLAKTSTLTVGGSKWPAKGWDGASAGGHHRVDSLTFGPGRPPTGQVVLTLSGVGDPVRFTWTLPAT